MISKKFQNIKCFLVYLQEYLAAKFVRSSQTCNYKFDNEQKHLTSGSCTEKHILVPFSHKYVTPYIVLYAIL